MALGDLGKRISDALAKTVKGAGDVVGITVEVTRSNLAGSLRGTRDVLS
jgi:hypothetical protein